MRGKNTIIINGRAYDATTGRAASGDIKPAKHSTTAQAASVQPAKLIVSQKVISDFGPSPARRSMPVPKAALQKTTPKVERTVRGAVAVHQKPQRSHTLLRQATKRPEAFAAPTSPLGEVQRSPMIQKFAPHPITAKSKPSTQEPLKLTAQKPEAAPKNLATQAISPAVRTIQAPANNSRTLKENLIKERLSEVDEAKKQKSGSRMHKMLGRTRAMHITTMCLALVMLGGYLTYINMPNLSVRVASARSGVTASYPEYRPDGYHFNGPVAYSPGEVTLSFKSNSSAQGYLVKQRASNWDSQAVLDNFVTKESDSYLTYSEQGLTIYTYSNKAAWVNGGVLYTIDGDAPLSSEQVLRIAASM